MRGSFTLDLVPFCAVGLASMDAKSASSILDTVNENGSTLLHLACASARASAELIAHLLKLGASAACVQGETGLLPLHIAIKSSASLATLELLIKAHPGGVGHKSKQGQTPLHVAMAELSQASIVAVLTALLAAEGAQSTVNSTDARGWTPLHALCDRPHNNDAAFSDAAHLLLKAGADATIQDKSGETALMRSLSCKNWRTVVEMADYESVQLSVAASSQYGDTALSRAATAIDTGAFAFPRLSIQLTALAGFCALNESSFMALQSITNVESRCVAKAPVPFLEAARGRIYLRQLQIILPELHPGFSVHLAKIVATYMGAQVDAS